MSAPVVIPRMAVPAPPVAQPHRFGLFTASVILENADPHELTGIEYEAVCAPRADPYPAACRPGDTFPRGKSAYPSTAVFNATPFAVYSADECVLGRDPDTARGQLRERFLLGEEAAVEKILFSGVLGNLPNLTINPFVIPATNPPDMPDAIGLLEQWLAVNYGGIGILHAPLTAAPRVQTLYELGVNGPRAGTVLGSAWAFGSGFPGSPPPFDHNGQPVADDGKLWLYVTPPVTIRRSALIEPADWSTGAFDTSQNVGMLISERLYVADWPCGAACVKTNLNRPGWVQPAASTTAGRHGRPATPPTIASAAAAPDRQAGFVETDMEVTATWPAVPAEPDSEQGGTP